MAVIGVLLGAQKGREVSVANSFELLYSVVDGKVVVDDEFLTTRRDQCAYRVENGSTDMQIARCSLRRLWWGGTL